MTDPLTSVMSARNLKSQPSSETGVVKTGGGYRAVIDIDKKSVYLGTFNTPQEAKAAYVEKLKEMKLEVKYVR